MVKLTINTVALGKRVKTELYRYLQAVNRIRSSRRRKEDVFSQREFPVPVQVLGLQFQYAGLITKSMAC